MTAAFPMDRLAIATQIYVSLIARSTRDLGVAIHSPTQRSAVETLAVAALGLADVLLAADASSRPASLATR